MVIYLAFVSASVDTQQNNVVSHYNGRVPFVVGAC